MTKEYRPWAPEQAFLLPPSPMEWLPEGHLAYFLLELVRELDLSGIEDVIQSKDGRGTRPYPPRMMTALLLYAYSVGVFSSRKIERATYEDVAFRVLSGGHHPYFTTVNEFRLQHREALSSDARAKALDPRDDDDDDSQGGAGADLPSHRVPATAEGAPTDKAQRNFTDPDSRIMVKNGVFLQAFNAHVAVSDAQLIVAHALTNQPPDAEHLIPMLERVRDNTGGRPEVFTADNGYLSEKNVRYCEAQAIDAYIATGRSDDGKLGRLPMSSAQEVRWEMHQKLASPVGRAAYARRKAIVEPVFGQIKQARGFRRFSLRGLAKAAAEWGIVCLCHNVLKLFRHSPTLLAVMA